MATTRAATATAPSGALTPAIPPRESLPLSPAPEEERRGWTDGRHGHHATRTGTDHERTGLSLPLPSGPLALRAPQKSLGLHDVAAHLTVCNLEPARKRLTLDDVWVHCDAVFGGPHRQGLVQGNHGGASFGGLGEILSPLRRVARCPLGPGLCGAQRHGGGTSSRGVLGVRRTRVVVAV
jgi:hypothetical protein